MATVESKMKALGIGPPDSVLQFSIRETTGFVVTARMSHNDDVVAKWKSEEIVGKTVEEPLTLPGAYKLELLVSVFSKKAMDVNVDVALTPPGGAAAPKTMTFKNKKTGDVCEALAFAVIQ